MVGAFKEKDAGCMYWMWKLQIRAISKLMSITTDTTNNQSGSFPLCDPISRITVKAKYPAKAQGTG